MNAILHEYCHCHFLMLNVSKCKIMSFNCSDKSYFIDKILLNGDPLEMVSEYRYLGYTIDDKLKFKSHLKHVANSLSACNSCLSRACNFIPKYSLFTLFNALGLSHILYSRFILLNASKTDKKIIQNKILHSGAIIENCLLKKNLI